LCPLARGRDGLTIQSMCGVRASPTASGLVILDPVSTAARGGAAGCAAHKDERQDDDERDGQKLRRPGRPSSRRARAAARHDEDGRGCVHDSTVPRGGTRGTVRFREASAHIPRTPGRATSAVSQMPAGSCFTTNSRSGFLNGTAQGRASELHEERRSPRPPPRLGTRRSRSPTDHYRGQRRSSELRGFARRCSMARRIRRLRDSAAVAAFAPHAPWTPPPGWALALARNRSVTGVE
jgi:hypothetical protein